MPFGARAYSSSSVPRNNGATAILASGFINCKDCSVATTPACDSCAAFALAVGDSETSTPAMRQVRDGRSPDSTVNATFTTCPPTVSNAPGPSRATELHVRCLSNPSRSFLVAREEQPVLRRHHGLHAVLVEPTRSRARRTGSPGPPSPPDAGPARTPSARRACLPRAR